MLCMSNRYCESRFSTYPQGNNHLLLIVKSFIEAIAWKARDFGSCSLKGDLLGEKYTAQCFLQIPNISQPVLSNPLCQAKTFSLSS